MKRGRVTASLLLVLALSLVLFACGGSDTVRQPAATTVTVDMHDIYFGESSDNVANPPGDDSEVTFEAPVPGTYIVICTIPGHAAVMQGQLVVAD